MEYFVAKDKPVATLTPKEIQVLSLLAEGYTNSEVAEILNISSRSAELYYSRIILKLNTHYLPGIELYALQHNLST